MISINSGRKGREEKEKSATTNAISRKKWMAIPARNALPAGNSPLCKEYLLKTTTRIHRIMVFSDNIAKKCYMFGATFS